MHREVDNQDLGVFHNKLMFAGGDEMNKMAVWVYDPADDSWSRTIDSLTSFMSGVGAVNNNMFFTWGAANGFHAMKTMYEILRSQIVGEVKQGQSIFYQVYGGNAVLRLNNADLPQGTSIAQADGYLESVFESGFGVLRGWVR